MIESINLSMAICCIWAWLIPHFYIEFMEYRLALNRSSGWNAATAGNSGSTTVESGNNSTANSNINNGSHANGPTKEDANKAMVQGAGAAVFILILV